MPISISATCSSNLFLLIRSHQLRRYFQKGYGKWDQHIRVKDEIKSMVTFERCNLMTDPPPQQEFDVIFCRNVLIYFDNTIKVKVINKLHAVLKWDGYFIIGGAESLNTVSHQYQFIKPSIYMKMKGHY